MTLILFDFIIYSSRERVLNNRRKKSQLFTKSSLKFTFDQGSYLTTEFARPNSNKAALLQISLNLIQASLITILHFV